MASIVAAAGLPHTPVYPRLAAGPDGAHIAARYAAVSRLLEEARPDVLCVFNCDHINAFFLDNWPTFAITSGTELICPVDGVPGVPATPVRVHTELAAHLHAYAVTQDFDLSLVLRGGADHGVAVPLHFLDPHARLPVVAVQINDMVAPFPSARRCFALGRALAEAVTAWPQDLRVALVASGSFSLDVGSPRVPAGHGHVIPRPDWAAQVADTLRTGRIGELLKSATPATLADAGTVAGEILSWFAVLGACTDLTLRHLDYEEGEGHAFATWTR
ncbi:extradiol ring-cleavage dioxygenase [Streptomyces tailanensis]|uniref:DODA-type extradiol aromatic ring-opening family dioxygenase n=1 Tax=Streptomyces tailanensis TaxID=2569858 RepID=UPI00122E6555|nr:extradiol ring-cleavage dioxygenase [Streptomyces tailanensis]